MDQNYPASWAILKHPWTRRDLLLSLEALTWGNPMELWADQRREGLVVGFNEVIHFFFDDHDFDADDVGFSLFDEREVALIAAVKGPLNSICIDLPNGDDLQSVRHPMWAEVSCASSNALAQMRPR
jgi:hypothetical protein